MTDNGDTVLEIRDLTVSFDVGGHRVSVVDEVSLCIPRGRVVALVGESGCGKSVTALSVLRLLPEPPARTEAGVILFRPRRDVAVGSKQEAAACPHGREPASGAMDLRLLRENQLRRVRGSGIAMVFQEPLTSLNPVMSAGAQIIEAIRLHKPVNRREARYVALDLLRDVGIPNPQRCFEAYPHELSGGMRQRAMIAAALACEPELLIADEPTTALDVTVQAQILDLLRSLQQKRALSVLLITHDLGVVAQVADDAYVMYAGRVVEHATTIALFAQPTHPYTAGLLACTPRVSSPRTGRLAAIDGTVPHPDSRPSGCAFHPRCRLSADLAKVRSEEAIDVAGGADGHKVLRSCVDPRGFGPSGQPALRQIAPDHRAACPEDTTQVSKSKRFLR